MQAHHQATKPQPKRRRVTNLPGTPPPPGHSPQTAKPQQHGYQPRHHTTPGKHTRHHHHHQYRVHERHSTKDTPTVQPKAQPSRTKGSHVNNNRLRSTGNKRQRVPWQTWFIWLTTLCYPTRCVAYSTMSSTSHIQVSTTDLINKCQISFQASDLVQAHISICSSAFFPTDCKFSMILNRHQLTEDHFLVARAHKFPVFTKMYWSHCCENLLTTSILGGLTDILRIWCACHRFVSDSQLPMHALDLCCARQHTSTLMSSHIADGSISGTSADTSRGHSDTDDTPDQELIRPTNPESLVWMHKHEFKEWFHRDVPNTSPASAKKEWISGCMSASVATGIDAMGDLVIKIEDVTSPLSIRQPHARATPLGAYPLHAPDLNAANSRPTPASIFQQSQRPVIPGSCMMISNVFGVTWYNSRQAIILYVDVLNARALVVLRHSGFIFMIALNNLSPISPYASLPFAQEPSMLAQVPVHGANIKRVRASTQDATSIPAPSSIHPREVQHDRLEQTMHDSFGIARIFQYAITGSMFHALHPRLVSSSTSTRSKRRGKAAISHITCRTSMLMAISTWTLMEWEPPHPPYTRVTPCLAPASRTPRAFP